MGVNIDLQAPAATEAPKDDKPAEAAAEAPKAEEIAAEPAAEAVKET